MLIEKIPNIQMAHADVSQAQVQSSMEGYQRQITVPETEEKERIRPREEEGKLPNGKPRKRRRGQGADRSAGEEAGAGEMAPRGGLLDIVI
jgi:hypothetical protein